MGPLEGIRIIEIAGIGPGPYCAMLLADMGAEVVRVVRPGPDPFAANPALDLLSRSRRSICVDLKTRERAVIAGVPTSFVATVRNYGPSPASNFAASGSAGSASTSK